MSNSLLRRPYKYVYFGVTKYLIALNVIFYLLCRYVNPLLFAYSSLCVRYVTQYHMYWSFVTYMFVHGGFLHLFCNMFSLFFIGSAVEKALGSKEFLTFYFVTGIIAGLLSFLTYYLTGQIGVRLVGASGAIFALIFLYAVIFPDSVICVFGLIPVKAPFLVLIYAIIEFFSQFDRSSSVAHMTHLFGLLGAWLYIQVRMGVNPFKVWKNSLRK